MTMITVQVELRKGEGARSVAKLIELASGYMELANRLPDEGNSWHIAGRVHVYREDFGEVVHDGATDDGRGEDGGA